jgi:hypothetical protein
MALPPHMGRERGHFTGFRGTGITRTLKVHDQLSGSMSYLLTTTLLSSWLVIDYYLPTQYPTGPYYLAAY